MDQPAALPPRRRRTALAIGVALLVVIAGGVLFAHDAIARAVLAAAGRSAGYDITAGTLHVGLRHVSVRTLRVENTGGEPVLTVARIDVDYSLRDLLPGGKRLFGLEAVDIGAPHLTLIHHRDGTYNVTLPPASNARAQSNAAPLDVRVRVRDGRVDIVDDFSAAPHERSAALVGVHADALLSPAQPSFYHAGAVLALGGARYPLAGNARFEDARGFEIQHWTMRRLPIAVLADFALPNRTLVIDAGELRNVDLTLSALRARDRTMDSHLAATGSLTGGRVGLAALSRPIEDVSGRFIVSDDGAAIPVLDARVNGIPVHVRGSIYHIAAPRVAFAITAGGDITRLTALATAAQHLAVRGRVAIHGLAEGTLANPVVFARFHSPHVDYDAFGIDDPHGFAAVSGTELDVLSSSLAYGPAVATGRARVLLRRHTVTEAYAQVAAASAGLPYADRILPPMQLRGTAVITGIDAQLATRGDLAGAAPAARLDAPFSVDANGSGDIGPVVLARADGAAVYARIRLDRPHDRIAAIVAAHALSLLPAVGQAPAIPGVALPPLPAQLDAHLDAALVASVHGAALDAAGGVVHAYGSFGDLRARADGSASNVALQGVATTSFDRLAALTGTSFGAHGAIDVPFAVGSDERRTLIQVHDARFGGAAIRGVAVQSVDATLALRPPAIDVVAADARVAGRDVTLHGSFGDGGRLFASAGDIDLAAFRAAGLPLTSGRATVLAAIGGSFAHPSARVRAALTGARYAGSSVGGDARLAFSGDTLDLQQANLDFGSAYANAAGTVSGLRAHAAPRYTLHVAVQDAEIAALARSVKNPLRYPAGTLDARLSVQGSGTAPHVTGRIAIPEGSLNGLSFHSASVGVAAGADGVVARDGRVTIGSTTLAFTAAVTRARQTASLHAPAIDLTDFNDYFDESAVLGGHGNIALTASTTPQSIAASARVAMSDVRFRRFAVGATNAIVTTHGRAIETDANVDGENGRFVVHGSVLVPATAPLRDTARRAVVDLRANISHVELGTVLPAAEIEAPLFGEIDGTVAVRGRYPDLGFDANATLRNGIAGRVPIESFTVAATAAGGRGRITQARLVTSAATVTASGAFGLHPGDPLALNAEAVAPDVDALALLLAGRHFGVGGALDERIAIGGTLAAPAVTSTTDLNALAYHSYVVPNVHVEAVATRQRVDVRRGTITLQHGNIAFDGGVPLTTTDATPVRFDFIPQDIDVTQFAALLPAGTKLQGVLDGNVALRGTLGAPQLAGRLSFGNGSLQSSALRAPVTALALQLDFAGSRITLTKIHAHAAPGDIDGSGFIALRTLRDPRAAYTANAQLTFTNARIDDPQLFAGTLGGTLTAVKTASTTLTIGGQLAISDARIPYQALLPTAPATSGTSSAAPDVAFDLAVDVGKNVRVQSGPVDIGATGDVTLGGVLAKPTLDGTIRSTDGTIAFYRTFIVQSGSTVAFSPDQGLIPTLDASATTSVPDPPVNVLLAITGRATAPHLEFSSDPSYDQQQILGLLVGAQQFGAVPGVAGTGTTNTGVGNAAVGYASGVASQQFTRQFLTPVTSQIGNAIGLSNFDVNYAYGSGVSAIAQRNLGKNIALTYGETFGAQNPRSSLGLRIGSTVSSANLTFYSSPGAAAFSELTPFLQAGFLQNQTVRNYTLTAAEPPNGTEGFVLTYQRHFW